MKKKKVLVTLLLASMCAASFSLAGCEALESLLGSSSSATGSSVKESSVSDSSEDDSSVPDSSVSDSSEDESSVSDSSEPDSSVPDSSEPDSSVPDSSVPEECTEHDWSEVVVLEWDDFKGEFKASVKGGCKNCDAPVPEEAILSEVTVADTATCTEAGTITYSATLTLNDEVIATGKVEEESPIKPHLASEYSSDPLYHWYAKADYCHCEDVVEEKIPHASKPVYDYNKGTTTVSCSECGYNSVLDYIVNGSTVEVGENTFYLTTPKTTVIPNQYYNEETGLFLEQDSAIPGNYLVPIVPDNIDESTEEDEFWQYEYVSKPASELVEGVDYSEIRDRNYTTEYDVYATFKAEETGEYTFSVPSGTFVQMSLTTSGGTYNNTYYTIGCDIYYNNSTTATIVLAEGDTVSFKMQCVAEHTDTDPDDDIDTNVSYGGKGSYKFTMSVTYAATSIPGKSADSAIFSTIMRDQSFSLNAGDSMFYAIEYSDYINYTYKYFTLTLNQPVEVYADGVKVEMTENNGSYTSTDLRCEKGKPAIVEIRNTADTALDVQMGGDVVNVYPYELNEGVNEITLPAGDLTYGVQITCNLTDEEGNPLPFTVTMDEASFTAGQIVVIKESFSWMGTTIENVAGYIDGAFVAFTTETMTEFDYQFQGVASDAETVTFIITVTKVAEQA